MPLTEEQQRQDPFAFGKFHLRARVDQTFNKSEYLGVYFEIYNASVDPSKDLPALKVEYRLVPREGQPTPFRDISRSALIDRDIVAVPLYIDISSQTLGTCAVVFRITDLIRNTTIESKADFKIIG
jgi:hypothetical protein